mmetsp:Transcript_36000/g.88582  ORF Transcript_36000/g.88582 Transcript_36000/m.88582 type:complete len:508 (+) Transcript_36000:110-1633(+)|eukprot:CAMPEP_0206284436 /NCGR_PEP_ID=MMETSP0047_2-20121206/40770_1 /ASSEMBLY_ACC=CAM_ASM_000192 /TAXON_ID=195065 /ORGANISM="Chroomonas mesostigmatica_cf, Strain CCMP1168" /LENGTH=507 /DNA_ID=CAMNT_0053714883 /DNA_START=59 /DNA_END=1582 /DNA_ORIENTATION=-
MAGCCVARALLLLVVAPALVGAFLSPAHGFLPRQGGGPRARSGGISCSAAPPQAPPATTARCPVDEENGMFECSDSVTAWGEGHMRGIAAWNPPQQQMELVEGVAAGAHKFVQSLQRSLSTATTSRDRVYWAYHVARASFFAGLGIAGYAAAALSGRFGLVSGGGLVVNNGTSSIPNIAANYAFRFDESLVTFEQDLKNIKKGLYKMPWDMEMGVRHQQARPTFVATKAGQLVREASSILQRSWRQREEDKYVWFFGQDGSSEQSIYPEYYRNNFHYQTDGWMSDSSAAVYEASTETIFMGRQDCMQRTSLIPVGSWMREKGLHKAEGKGVTALEIACGTGRFNTFLRDNWPLMDSTMSDLSPFYLSEARKNSDYWERERRKDMPTGRAAFAQTNAEDLSQFGDASFDVVVNMYLFHELPLLARERAAKEMARVCKPGGLLVFCDSVQIGDRVGMGESMRLFTRLNEPYYESYLDCDIPRLFTEAGLEPGEKHLSSTTKVLSFKKKE